MYSKPSGSIFSNLIPSMSSSLLFCILILYVKSSSSVRSTSSATDELSVAEISEALTIFS